MNLKVNNVLHRFPSLSTDQVIPFNSFFSLRDVKQIIFPHSHRDHFPNECKSVMLGTTNLFNTTSLLWIGLR